MGLPVVRWRSSGCAPRSPQQIVCRRRAGSPAAVAAHKCFAPLALVLPFARRRCTEYRGERRRVVAQKDCPSSGGRSSGLRPSLATADSLPSSRGQSGGCRRPQVLRSARTCAALRSTATYHYRFGRRSGWSPQARKRDHTSRGREYRRHDRRRVFACLLVAPVFLLEENSVTARLSFGTPARAISGGSRAAPTSRGPSWPTTPRHACTTL